MTLPLASGPQQRWRRHEGRGLQHFSLLIVQDAAQVWSPLALFAGVHAQRRRFAALTARSLAPLPCHLSLVIMCSCCYKSRIKDDNLVRAQRRGNATAQAFADEEEWREDENHGG